jgi:hypothetical protein
VASVMRNAFREYSDVLTDANVAQFLATKRWSIQRDRDFDQIWVSSSSSLKSSSVLQLPRDSGLMDYSRRMVEVLETLCEAYGWTPSEVANQVALARADLFFVRVDQHMSDGTIPLRQASTLLDSIDQMIRSSAISAYSPTSSGRGRMPGAVNDFLTDDVRMGHTKKGSFIITVAARLDDLDLANLQDPPPDAKPSFTRQVMTNLNRSLIATKKQVQGSDASKPTLSEAVDGGLKLPVIQALENMSDAEGLRNLDMSFEWAASEHVDSGVQDRVLLSKSELSALPGIRERMTKRWEPQLETVVGPVVELRRSETPSQDKEDLEIVMRADVDGRLVKVAVPLSGTDYDWAIRAHRAKLPFTVTGVLGKKGNSWRLTDSIEVDREFLEHHFETKRE